MIINKRAYQIVLMNISRLIRSLLDRHAISYTVLDAAMHTPALHRQAQCALLKGDHRLLLAIYPARHRINLTALQSIKRHRLHHLGEDELGRLVKQTTQTSARGSPALPEIQLILDAGLNNEDTLHFEDTEHGEFLRINAEDLLLISDDTLIGSAFSEARPAPGDEAPPDEPRLDLRERIRRIDTLPALPDMAHRLLIMRNDPNATIGDLAQVVEHDSALSAQIMRYANSSLFGQKGQVTTIEDAIFRVLGFDHVLNLALGVATARTFRLPPDGPLGLRQQWQHALHTANLAQTLASLIPRHGDQPQPAVAYLAGLLHDIGFLAMGQLFAPEYFWLGKLLRARKDVPVVRMERQLLGTGHTELGRVLMQGWHMPEAIIVAAAEHHNDAYEGEFAVYARLIQLSDRLLAREEYSDANNEDLPPRLLAQLGLDEEQALAALETLHTDRDILDAMARQLIA